MKFEIYPLGDSALTICFGDEIAPQINDNVLKAAESIEALDLSGLFELIPTYCTLMIHYNKQVYSFAKISKILSELLGDLPEKFGTAWGRNIEIPVCYGGELGPDIENVAKHTKLSEDEVVRLHSEAEYRVYMLGFLAGFPYLGGLNPKLETPRLDSPRTKIEAGSVGIAGKQTGAYSIASPGGWQLIGRTPIKLYDIRRPKPALLQAGDRVRFKPINFDEYQELVQSFEEENGDSSPIYSKESSKERIEEIEERERKAEECAAFTVKNAGFLTTIQDQGRNGYRSMGVSVSGAMDKASAALANMLIGNSYKEAVLECMAMGPVLSFSKDTQIAITGAGTTPKINGVEVKEYKAIKINAGDELSFGPVTQGMFIYIAFENGIDVPKELGSRSTHMRTQMGGLEGRKLVKGDCLFLRKPFNKTSVKNREEDFGKILSFRTVWHKEITLRVIPDRFESRFTKKGIDTFYSSQYTVSTSCDRMGYRLEGEKIEHIDGADIITDVVIMGSVQITPKGQPIIMMADCQTTGGYTRIGNIISEDLPKLAQCTPGCKIKFELWSN